MMTSEFKTDLNNNNLLSENSLVPIQNQPNEILLTVFGLLSKEDLVKVCRVCKLWNKLVSENIFLKDCSILKMQFPSLKVIDKSIWKAYLDVDIEDEPPLDKRTDIPVLQNLISTLKIEGDAGLTLITIPKGLTLNELLGLASKPKRGNATKCRCIQEPIVNTFGNISVSKTYRVLISNNLVEGSRIKSAEEQENLVKRLECEISELLPTIALIFMTYISSQKESPICLYFYNPFIPSYIRLKEKAVEGFAVVGGFAGNKGLSVCVFTFDNSKASNIGVAALRKF